MLDTKKYKTALAYKSGLFIWSKHLSAPAVRELTEKNQQELALIFFNYVGTQFIAYLHN